MTKTERILRDLDSGFRNYCLRQDPLAEPNVKSRKPEGQKMNKIELRAIRTKAKMSQSAFAKALGVSQFTICQWEGGKSTPAGGWDGADLKKKLAKLEVLAPPSKVPAAAKSKATEVTFCAISGKRLPAQEMAKPKTAREALQHNRDTFRLTMAAKATKNSRKREIPSFVHYLASTLLSATRLNQARELLMTAKEEGLDLDRLLGLLGVT